MDLTLWDNEVDPSKNLAILDAGVEIADFEHGRGHWSSL
jgi:hypothetical protein